MYLAWRMFSGFNHVGRRRTIGRVDRGRRFAGVRRSAHGGVRVERVEDVCHQRNSLRPADSKRLAEAQIHLRAPWRVHRARLDQRDRARGVRAARERPSECLRIALDDVPVGEDLLARQVLQTPPIWMSCQGSV